MHITMAKHKQKMVPGFWTNIEFVGFTQFNFITCPYTLNQIYLYCSAIYLYLEEGLVVKK